MAKPYEFNNTIGIDINYITDCEGKIFQFLNIVCCGTDFQIEVPIRSGKGQPTSRECYDALQTNWIQPFGYPKVLRCDRGLHNRGVLSHELAVAGVQVSNAGLEAPYQIGKGERDTDRFT